MNRLRCALLAGLLAGLIPGCGEDQPNRPASPEEATPDFARKSADMMKAANAGMDPKKARTGGMAPAPKK
jgi:hypothetical protein